VIKNKKILVTGGAGFIGLHLIKKLFKFNKIVILDNFQRGKFDKELRFISKNKNVKIINTDLVSFNKKKKLSFDYVFLLASIVGVKNVNEKPFNTLKVNILSVFNTLDFVRFHKNTRLVYFSTSEVYSPLVIKKKKYFPIKENTDLLFLNEDSSRYTYYISKILGEKLVKFSGYSFVILRPHNIYGPRMGFSHVIPEQINKIKNKSTSKVFSPTHKRAFCYIDDAINQIIQICFLKKNYNKIYNIGNPKQPISMMKLSKLIQNQLKTKTKLIPGKITSGSINNRVPFIKKELLKNCNTKLIDGIQKTIKWYLENEKI
jgi:UDP-glucose 4-epimerase